MDIKDSPSAKKEQLFIIKIGGNLIDDSNKLNTFLKSYSLLNYKKILVHGGGKIATGIGKRLGITTKYINGRRITDDEAIDIVTMVYGGLINKKIVAQLQSYKCNAIGVTGADANLIPAAKREVRNIDYGWVGDIAVGSILPFYWEMFLNNNLFPIVAPLTHDGGGHILNTNADTIAASISIALSDKYEIVLIYCFDKRGVLENIYDEDSVIPLIDRSRFDELLKNNQISEGMLPKIENALSAIESGVNSIIIGNADDLLANATGEKKGTLIYKKA